MTAFCSLALTLHFLPPKESVLHTHNAPILHVHLVECVLIHPEGCRSVPARPSECSEGPYAAYPNFTLSSQILALFIVQEERLKFSRGGRGVAERVYIIEDLHKVWDMEFVALKVWEGDGVLHNIFRFGEPSARAMCPNGKVHCQRLTRTDIFQRLRFRSELLRGVVFINIFCAKDQAPRSPCGCSDLALSERSGEGK